MPGKKKGPSVKMPMTGPMPKGMPKPMMPKDMTGPMPKGGTGKGKGK